MLGSPELLKTCNQALPGCLWGHDHHQPCRGPTGKDFPVPLFSGDPRRLGRNRRDSRLGALELPNPTPLSLSFGQTTPATALTESRRDGQGWCLWNLLLFCTVMR